MIIGDDGLFAKYDEGWREFVFRRWRSSDLAEIRLERGCRLGLAVDDADDGGDRACPVGIRPEDLHDVLNFILNAGVCNIPNIGEVRRQWPYFDYPS